MDNNSTPDDSTTFFKHVFNFDDDSKSEILNILQYSLLAIIPIVLLNKTMQKYVPEADDQKSSLETGAEIVIQIILMFIGLLLIHRVITYVPTYSASKYPEFHIVYIVLAVLMITLSLQTKLGEKVSILVDRLMEMWNGKPEKKKGGGKNNVKVSQPLSGVSSGAMMMPQPPTMTDGTAISSLPSFEQQQTPNYDAMYRQDNTPLVNAATPGGGSMVEGMTPFEPMAANAVLGGSGFGSW